MTPALLTLALLAQPEAHIGRVQAARLARVCRAAEIKHRLPAGILCAVALAETGGRWKLAKRRGQNRAGCDVGPWQLHIPGCPLAVVRIMRRAPLAHHAEAAAWLLRARWQSTHRYPWRRYNPGSLRWSRRVADIYRRIKAHRGRAAGRVEALASLAARSC